MPCLERDGYKDDMQQISMSKIYAPMSAIDKHLQTAYPIKHAGNEEYTKLLIFNINKNIISKMTHSTTVLARQQTTCKQDLNHYSIQILTASREIVKADTPKGTTEAGAKP